MLCNKIKPLLQDYLDGDLSHNVRHEIADHLKTCGSCRAEYQELQQLGELARTESIPVPEKEDTYWQTAWRKIEQRIPNQPNGIGMFNRFWDLLRPQFQFARLAYTAAIFCFGLIFGGYIFHKAPIAPEEIMKVKPIEKTVVQYQEVPKLIEKPKYRVRYVVLEPAKETVAPTQPATGTVPAIIAVSTPELEPEPDAMTRQQIEQVQKELQKSFDEHNVDNQIAQILGQT